MKAEISSLILHPSSFFFMYALIDCNNFYASCERLFDPRLEKQAVIVLSNNDGCVVARSQEAKQFGIKMGEPFFKIRDLCRYHKIAVFSSNYQLYGDISERVMNILSELAEEIEIYSIDEAFLLYPSTMDSERIFADCVAMREKIKKWVGIPTSIGIAPTKTLAKLANDLVKKRDRERGVLDFTSPALQESVMKESPVETIWGVGSNNKRRLNTLGIYSVRDFYEADPLLIRKKMGVVGERMLWELRGVSCLPLTEAAPKKSITCSRSFGQVLTEYSDLAEAISTHVNTASVKLREQNSCATAMVVFAEFVIDAKAGIRQTLSSTVTFPFPTSDTSQMITAAKECLRDIYKKDLRYKKCGIILLDLIDENLVMPDLFCEKVSPRRSRLSSVVDAINDYYGKKTLFYGAMGVSPRWTMQRSNCSRQFTTSWDSLALARA